MYEAPARIIAEDREDYYAKKDSNAEDMDATYEDVYETEMEVALNDRLELHDWLLNNMNWEDIEEEAELDKEPTIDPADALRNQRAETSLETED